MNKYTHFRRCHVCGCINEAGGHLVSVCQQCGKHLSPFYFFDEKRALGIQGDSKENPVDDPENLHLRTTSLPLTEYPPLIGLTASWD